MGRGREQDGRSGGPGPQGLAGALRAWTLPFTLGKLGSSWEGFKWRDDES